MWILEGKCEQETRNHLNSNVSNILIFRIKKEKKKKERFALPPMFLGIGNDMCKTGV